MADKVHFTRQDTEAFRGFEPLDANYIYCPNQFFEVCLRHNSRGVVRLVAYMLRTTLGHLDKNGNPVKQDIRISYSDLSKYAGVSTRAIPKALKDAGSSGFILCVTPGMANSRGQRGQAAEYRLQWSPKVDRYTDDPKQFTGFYSGEGRRSPIPNGYFDVIIRRETLAMAKVVGTILRHTAGYQNQFGGRRSEAPLSFSYIQRFANLRDRTTLSETLKDATKKGYIQCVSKGYFDPNAGRQSRAASYAVKWLDKAANSMGTAITLPDKSQDGKNPTLNTAITRPEKDGTNPTDRKTVSKDSYKQQVVVENVEGYEMLVEERISKAVAIKLSKIATLEEIQNQIKWLEFRKPENRPAMLRTAIEENWDEPVVAQVHTPHQAMNEGQQSKRIAAVEKTLEHQDSRRSVLLSRWRTLSSNHQSRFRKTAIDQAISSLKRNFLIRQTNLDNPPIAFLETMEREIGIGKST